LPRRSLAYDRQRFESAATRNGAA